MKTHPEDKIFSRCKQKMKFLFFALKGEVLEVFFGWSSTLSLYQNASRQFPANFCDFSRKIPRRFWNFLWIDQFAE